MFTFANHKINMAYRNKILAQVEGMFLKHGIRSVTMDEIARELGMSKKTLYQYFENKAALLEQVVNSHLANEHKQLEHIRQNSVDAIDEMLAINQHVMSMLRELNPQVFTDLQKYYPVLWEDFNRRNEDEIYNTVYNNLLRGMEEGVYQQDLNPEIIARLYVFRSDFMMEQKVVPCTGANIEEVIRHVLVYHMRGVMNDRGKEVFESRILAEI